MDFNFKTIILAFSALVIMLGLIFGLFVLKPVAIGTQATVASTMTDLDGVTSYENASKAINESVQDNITFMDTLTGKTTFMISIFMLVVLLTVLGIKLDWGRGSGKSSMPK